MTLQDGDRGSGREPGSGWGGGGEEGRGVLSGWGCASILEQARSVLGNVTRAGRSAGQARPRRQCHH